MWALFAMVAGSAVMWLQYVDLKDHIQPEDRDRLIAAFILGVMAGVLALLTYGFLMALGLNVSPEASPARLAELCFFVVGPVEEGWKVLMMVLVITKWPEFDEVFDGFVYAAALSIGFATLENLLHLPSLPLVEQLARTATLPLTHTLFAAVWGLPVAYAQLRMPKGATRITVQVVAVAAAMLLHGLYDYLLLAWGATLPATAIVLVLWIGVILTARHQARFEPALPSARPAHQDGVEPEPAPPGA
jgi:protease PrsW